MTKILMQLTLILSEYKVKGKQQQGGRRYPSKTKYVPNILPIYIFDGQAHKYPDFITRWTI
jgi:hypothetical protein